jgi:hypothetical protein
MKTIWMIVIFLLLVGCGGSISVEPDPPIVVLLQPKAEITINPGLGLVIPYGFEVKISWESENAKYCILNNETVQTSGSIRTKLYENTTYTIKAINGDLSYTTVKAVTVASWTTSDLGLLTHDYWLLKSLKFIQDGEVVSSSVLSDVDKTDKYYFYLNGDFKVFHATGVRYSSGQWYFSGNGTDIFIVSTNYNIISLTANEFICNEPAVYNGKPCILQTTYWRSSVIL